MPKYLNILDGSPPLITAGVRRKLRRVRVPTSFGPFPNVGGSKCRIPPIRQSKQPQWDAIRSLRRNNGARTPRKYRRATLCGLRISPSSDDRPWLLSVFAGVGCGFTREPRSLRARSGQQNITAAALRISTSELSGHGLPMDYRACAHILRTQKA